MYPSDQKEQFSYAYIHAVATVAGYILVSANRLMDNAGIDMEITAVGDRNLPREPRLSVQVKCTGRDLLREETLAFPLEVAHYDRLRNTETIVPRILVVILFPTNCKIG